jgi:hypothetical protein
LLSIAVASNGARGSVAACLESLEGRLLAGDPGMPEEAIAVVLEAADPPLEPRPTEEIDRELRPLGLDGETLRLEAARD